MHIYGIQKGGTNEFICKAAMEKTTWRTDEWTRGESEMYEESNMATYITIYKINSQWKFPEYVSGNSKELCINREGWDGEGDRRQAQDGEDICIPMADLC